MLCYAKQSLANLSFADQIGQKIPFGLPQISSFSSTQILNTHKSNVSASKPLYISSTNNFKYFDVPKDSNSQKLSVQCNAYEAQQSSPLSINLDFVDPQKVKIGVYFATWWALNVVFNIYNKKVLNAFPYPWLTSTLSLATGSLMMLVSWASGIAEAPKTDLNFWKALFPVSIILVSLP